MEYLQSADFWIGLLKIVWINIILSGDNAVVIALAARSLPPAQQKKAVMFGSGAAVVLRIILTVVAAKLLELSFLQIVGGCLLLWIGSALGRARLGWARRFLRQHRTRCQQQKRQRKGNETCDHYKVSGYGIDHRRSRAKQYARVRDAKSNDPGGEEQRTVLLRPAISAHADQFTRDRLQFCCRLRCVPTTQIRVHA